MACMASEKTSPLTQKRCSLPGPGGSLNLYSTHQQRRLSERGLMIYKPNKPDIDLIRDFTNANQRKHSTPNFTLYPGGANPGPSCSSAGASTGLKYAQGTFGSLSQLNRNFHGPSSAGPSPSAYRRNSSLASFSSYAAANAGASTSSTDGAMGMMGTGNMGLSNSSVSSSAAVGGTARKVRIRIQKNPGATTEKYVELHSIGKNRAASEDLGDDGTGGLDGDDMTESERSLFLRSPLFDSRRFSDSAVCRGPTTPAITFSLTPDTSCGGDGNECNNPGILRRSSDSGPGIVLSTGDLETLKCLTSSAQEISSTAESDQTGGGTASPTNLGNRSKSFDATLSVSKRGLGSSWFVRRHLPMSHKLPTGSSPSSTQPLRTPILTITNENACQSELIEIPSPPTVTPVSSGGSPNEVVSTVPWDKNGYVLDAALLGSAIEHHLKQGNRKRRATFSTLYQAPPSSVECKVTTRARSASACVIPINPKDLMQGSSGNRRESISTDRVIPNFPLSEKIGNRRSSLKSMVRFPWDSGKDTQSPESKSLLWESPVEYTNSGSFIRTTITDFGDDCIDEEEEESRTPETSTSNIVTDSAPKTTQAGASNRKNFVGSVEVNKAASGEFTFSSAPNSATGKKGIRGFELPSSSKGGKSTATGDRDVSSSHSHSAPASPKPTKRGSESNMSICSAIRDFIIHSIRS